MTPLPHLVVALSCHRATPSSVVRKIDVRAAAADGGKLSLTYSVQGDMSRVRVPQPRSPRRADELWRRTCFEAFVTGPDAPAYYELNFSPSAQWALYRFRSYREDRCSPDDVPAPSIAVCRTVDRLELEARFAFDALPGWRSDAGFRLALSAVIEDSDGRLSCWSLAHPAERPDFHHAGGFLLEAGPTGVAWAGQTPDRGLA